MTYTAVEIVKVEHLAEVLDSFVRQHHVHIRRKGLCGSGGRRGGECR